jgi:serine/threonine protein kinase
MTGTLSDEDQDRIDKVVNSFVDTIIEDENGKYKVVKLLGIGGMGYVFLVMKLGENKLYAMKYLPYRQDDYPSLETRFGDRRTLMDNEITCLKVIKDVCNEHFLCYVDSFEINFNGHDGKILVTEFLEGYIEANPDDFTFEDKIWFFTTLIEIMKDLHSKGIAHGDIHEGNILVNLNHSNIKLLDFGLCKITPTEKQFSDDWSNIVGLVVDYIWKDEDMDRPETVNLIKLFPKEYFNVKNWNQRLLDRIGLTGGWIPKY